MTLGKRADYGDAKFAGLQIAELPSDVDRAVQDVLLCGFDFVVAPLVRPGHRPAPPSAASQSDGVALPFGRDDVLYLPSSQWVRQVVGAVSGWLDPDSSDPHERTASQAALRAELGWAAHLGLQAVLLPPPANPGRCAQYAQILNQVMDGLVTMALWVTVPLGSSHAAPCQAQGAKSTQLPCLPPSPSQRIKAMSDTAATMQQQQQQQQQNRLEPGVELQSGGERAAAAEMDAASVAAPVPPAQPLPESVGEVGTAAHTAASSSRGAGCGVEGDGWESWHRLRTLADYDNLLGAVLQLESELPPQAQLQRWLGEPVKAVLLPTRVFTANKRGYPVLPKAHQEFVSTLFAHQVQVLVSGPCVHATPDQLAPGLGGTTPSGMQPGDPTPAEAAGPQPRVGQHRPLQQQQQQQQQLALVAVNPQSGAGFVINNPGESHPLRPYWEYLAYLFRKLPAIPDELRQEMEYRDYLQAPLQPLQAGALQASLAARRPAPHPYPLLGPARGPQQGWGQESGGGGQGQGLGGRQGYSGQGDNLESATYEVFERDTVKYVQYEEAIFRALLDMARTRDASDPNSSPQATDPTPGASTTPPPPPLPLAAVAAADSAPPPPPPSPQHLHSPAPPGPSPVQAGSRAQQASGTPLQSAQPTGAASSPQHGQSGRPVVVMVVGAGRGPLVAAAMRAAARAGAPLRVYAVEKNPFAVVHIQEMLRREGWQQQVEIVSADMRQWQAPEAADILVSELLGSFGDNELSPECLDGAQRFLAPGTGISIPASYTSFWAPITSTKLWHDVRAFKDREHFETPFVVKLHRHHVLAPPQPVFTFSHPNLDSPINNTRFRSFAFSRPLEAGSAVCHGFAGYFECELYGGVQLSTRPASHTPNMASWFPIFFPLAEPVYAPAGRDIECQLWRCCSRHKV
ncbi:hypothetical protein QJQ45_009372 [Haematococcus lacustris]|nr:hypothetical protein QJQ45_009372 [Haematococcus lacustris]